MASMSRFLFRSAVAIARQPSIGRRRLSPAAASVMTSHKILQGPYILAGDSSQYHTAQHAQPPVDDGKSTLDSVHAREGLNVGAETRGCAVNTSESTYWQNVKNWEEVPKEEFLSYRWQVSASSFKLTNHFLC